MEEFEDNLFGLKFYDKSVSNSPKRYSLLTNDYEPRTIIFSCIQIMLDYFTENKHASFGFIAAPDIEKQTPKKIKNCDNKRFRFYRRLMLSLFGPETFVQIHDKNNVIYFLINKKAFDNGELTIEKLETMINKLYEGDYALMGSE
ncbi:MAG: hypothetical protein NC324_02745 [Bacteroides sp.]|nr:hypothetical protein [Bacteroides sp.]